MSASSSRPAQILWVGKNRRGTPSFTLQLASQGFKLKILGSGAAAQTALSKRKKPDVLVVDAASLRTSGTSICRSLKSSFPNIPVILINSTDFLPASEVCADIQLVLPFTTRKLANRIKRFVSVAGEDLIKAGPIRLDTGRLVLHCDGREEQISPRMAALLQLLLEKKGEVLKREFLFRKAWKTDYVEDTRSLDVHISWLRKILEKDPSNPELLLTKRGVGYLLDLPEE